MCWLAFESFIRLYMIMRSRWEHFALRALQGTAVRYLEKRLEFINFSIKLYRSLLLPGLDDCLVPMC